VSQSFPAQLQPRLQAIALCVPEGARLTDVGTDHGYLPLWLLREGRIASAIATDIGALPLEHARRSAELAGVALELRMCDGLAAVQPEETDCVVIAGMGGETIIHILAAAPWTKNGTQLLLQCMTKAELLRSWLAENGYRIEGEQLVLDKGILYPIIKASGGEMKPLSEAEAWIGFADASDPLYSDYRAERIGKLRWAMDGLGRSDSESAAARRGQIAALLKALEEGKEEQG